MFNVVFVLETMGISFEDLAYAAWVLMDDRTWITIEA